MVGCQERGGGGGEGRGATRCQVAATALRWRLGRWVTGQAGGGFDGWVSGKTGVTGYNSGVGSVSKSEFFIGYLE